MAFKSLLNLALAIYFWSFVVISFIITIPVCLIAFPFVAQKTFSKIFLTIPTYIVFAAMTWPNIWKVTIHDKRSNKIWYRNFVIVANHLSMVDSLVLVYAIPLKIKYMIAAVFTKIPIFGDLIRAAGYVTADLHDPNLNQTAVDRAIETIQLDDCSFALYPEGRRELKPYHLEKFKTGAFRIAKETGLPILPVTLHGTEQAMGFGSAIRPAEITVWIDEPFMVMGDNYEKYINHVKNIMTENLNDNN